MSASSPDRKPAPTARRNVRPWVVLLFVGCAWGATPPLSKLAVSSGHHPIGVTFWSVAVGATAFNAVLWLRGGRLRLNARHLGFFAICGLLGTVIPNVASFAAYRHLPVRVMVLCFASIPVITVLLSAAAGLERLRARRVAGIVLGAAAMGLIAVPDAGVPAGQAVWVALPVLAAAAYAAENVFIAARRPEGTGPLQVMAGLSLGALVLVTPAMLAADAGLNMARFGPEELAVLGTAVLHVFAYFGYVWLIDRAGSVFASQISYVVTSSGVVLGMLIYHERHPPTVWLALALMFAGLALVKPRHPPD